MNFTLASIFLSFMTVAALSTISTAAAEESNSLRGSAMNYPGLPTVKRVKTAPIPLRGWRHLEDEVQDGATYISPRDDTSFGSSSGSNGNSVTGSTYTAPPYKISGPNYS